MTEPPQETWRSDRYAQLSVLARKIGQHLLTRPDDAVARDDLKDVLAQMKEAGAGANAEEVQNLPVMNPVETFAQRAGNAASFGLGDVAAKAFDPETQRIVEASKTANPWAARLGTATGTAIPWLLPGAGALNMGARAAMGGAQGFGIGEGDLPTRLARGAGGAAVAAAAPVVADLVGKGASHVPGLRWISRLTGGGGEAPPGPAGATPSEVPNLPDPNPVTPGMWGPSRMAPPPEPMAPVLQPSSAPSSWKPMNLKSAGYDAAVKRWNISQAAKAAGLEGKALAQAIAKGMQGTASAATAPVGPEWESESARAAYNLLKGAGYSDQAALEASRRSAGFAMNLR